MENEYFGKGIAILNPTIFVEHFEGINKNCNNEPSSDNLLNNNDDAIYINTLNENKISIITVSLTKDSYNKIINKPYIYKIITGIDYKVTIMKPNFYKNVEIYLFYQ